MTIDVYGDNRGLIVDGVPGLEGYIMEVFPQKHICEKQDRSNFVIDIGSYFKE